MPADIADALASVLSKATEAIRDNEAGSRVGTDIEHVHQMRVATRRIRAYLKAAKPALDAGAADQLRSDLSALARVLGEVRDLDVMIDRLHSEADDLGGHDGEALNRLVHQLDSRRDAARAALVAELDRKTFPALLAELDAAAERPPVSDPWADLPALAAAEWGKLDKAQAKLQRRFGGNPPDDDLHELRIYGKRARYSAELLTGKGSRARRPAAVKRYLAALAELQEVLGNHQDAAVLEDQLRELVANAGTGGTRGRRGGPSADELSAALAAGRLIERCRMRKVQARQEFPGVLGAVQRAAAKAFGG